MYPPPKIRPLERLRVEDGLLINKERWARSHEYHRQRQNIHYQSLNQPGVVCGLGISLIPAPKDVSSQYNDQLWLQIQPGIAIDLIGNPIIVAQPMDFHLAVDPTEEQTRQVYIVISYIDPETLKAKQVQEFELETFRIDEKTTAPNPLEVELCRILLQPGVVTLEQAQDVFFPSLNSLDFRYRPIARSRPSNMVRVAYLQTSGTEALDGLTNFSSLLQSATYLTHTIETGDPIAQLNFQQQDGLGSLDYDLLFSTGNQPVSLAPEELSKLKTYLDAGGVLLIESPTEAVDRLESIVDITDKWETPLEDLRKLARNHPLRTQPFLFAALPILNQKPIQVLVSGGIVLVIGDLSTAWGLDEKLALPRETIRTAQELGTNILYFAWSRRQMTQLHQQQPISSLPTATKSQSLQNVLNKLNLDD
jgi:hypothetical protein